MAINLKKGERISLKKSDGRALDNFCIGANWGAINKKTIFGGNKKVAVDLDLSVGLFNAKNELIETVYFGHLHANGIEHSGDDLVGDVYGDDGLDNEVMRINLPYIRSNIKQVVFVLNSYKGQDFATIPFASIRLYEGTPTEVKSTFATYNVAYDSKFSGYTSMILGKLYKRGDEWKFSAIGEPTKDKSLQKTLQSVQSKYL